MSSLDYITHAYYVDHYIVTYTYAVANSDYKYGSEPVSISYTVPINIASGQDIVVAVNNDVGVGDEYVHFEGGTSSTKTAYWGRATYDGNKTFTATYNEGSDWIQLEVTFVPANHTYIDSIKVNPSLKNRTSFASFYSPITINHNTSSWIYYITESTSLASCFKGCTNLLASPALPSVSNIDECFSGCTSLTSVPQLPSSITSMSKAFYNCTSLSGNFDTYTSQINTEGNRDAFAGTAHELFAICHDSNTRTCWRSFSTYINNLHCEAYDNPPPTLSNLTAIRVSYMLEDEYSPTGMWAYITATVDVYSSVLPVGWTNRLNNKNLYLDGSSISPSWFEPESYPGTIYCWVDLEDLSSHTFELQVSDMQSNEYSQDKSANYSSVISFVFSKAYALVDYYHNPTTKTEGMAIGKYATSSDLLDIEMDLDHKGAFAFKMTDSLGDNALKNAIQSKTWSAITETISYPSDGSDFRITDDDYHYIELKPGSTSIVLKPNSQITVYIYKYVDSVKSLFSTRTFTVGTYSSYHIDSINLNIKYSRRAPGKIYVEPPTFDTVTIYYDEGLVPTDDYRFSLSYIVQEPIMPDESTVNLKALLQGIISHLT